MSEPPVWRPLQARRISRRRLLRSAGKSGIAVVGIALVGCGSDVDKEDIEAIKAGVSRIEEAVGSGEAAPTTEAREADAAPDATGGPESVSQISPRRPVRFPRRRIAALSSLREGELVRFEYPLAGQTSFLVKLGRPATGGVGPDGDVVAFSELCTHMGCPMAALYNRDEGILGPCVCHFTTFDLARRGQVVLGQATTNLPQIVLEAEGDDLFAINVLGIIYGYRDNLADGMLAEEA